jgi:hypothetical protein
MEKPEPVYSAHVLELLTVANEYCLFLEKVEQYPADEVLDYLRKILPMLYIKGSLLPAIQPDELQPERYVTEQQWETVFNDIRGKIGHLDEFHYIDHTEPSDPEPWKGSLADHLADVYQDLKDFILLFQKNTFTAQQNAVSECRQLFISHWGERITRAHTVIHQLHFRGNADQDEEL